MPLYIAFGYAGGYGSNVLPVEVMPVRVSETLSATGASTNSVGDDREIVTVTANEDGWINTGTGTPTASASPRRRILSGQVLSFRAPTGHKVAWQAGA